MVTGAYGLTKEWLVARFADEQDIYIEHGDQHLVAASTHAIWVRKFSMFTILKGPNFIIANELRSLLSSFVLFEIAGRTSWSSFLPT